MKLGDAGRVSDIGKIARSGFEQFRLGHGIPKDAPEPLILATR